MRNQGLSYEILVLRVLMLMGPCVILSACNGATDASSAVATTASTLAAQSPTTGESLPTNQTSTSSDTTATGSGGSSTAVDGTSGTSSSVTAISTSNSGAEIAAPTAPSPQTVTATSSSSADVVSSSNSSQVVAPIPAQQVGYTTRTYGPQPALQGDSTTSGGTATLYSWNFFGQSVSPNFITENGDTTITLSGGGNANAQLASAEAANNSQRFHGIAFGGGAYFEAVLKFDGWQNQTVAPTPLSEGFPAFWSMSIEHLSLNGSAQWPNQPAGYEHFGEFDFFEYDVASSLGSTGVYSGSAHDWYGVFDNTCPQPVNTFCVVSNERQEGFRSVPTNTNFSEFHAYGALWVPATADTDGYIEYFFDGVQVGQKFSWPRLSDPSAISTPGIYAFAIADLQHMVVILGTGASYPMTISTVSVWQSTAAQNLVN
jgi:hypothetical protein